MKKTKSHTPPLSSFKKRIFLALTIFIPVLFLVCLELALRYAGYGTDVSLFKRHIIRGQTFYQMNPSVKFRYFGTTRFAPSTSPGYFQVPKPQGMYRIFCLGGSTTVGYPYYYNGSFSTYLYDRLRAIYPQKKVEIINLGMTATNSFTALDIVRELADYQPDLIIDYDGHNEFYGALGAASNQTIGSSRFATLLYLRLIHFRTFQLLRDAIEKSTGLIGGMDNSVSRGTEMERLSRDRYVSYGSSLYNAAYSIFRENLGDMKEYCRSAHIPLILGTQVSNLRDQPPFISKNSPELTEQQRVQFQQLYKSGLEFQSKRMLDSAVVVFRSAIALDSQYADAHYRFAQCLDAEGRKAEALHEYILARDYDELRFRTDGKFNNLLQSMDDHKDCFVADIEAAFKSLSPDSLIGYNLITEHLHPNSRGYFVIAKSFAQTMRDHGLLAARQEWNSVDTVNDDKLWEERSVTELDDRIAARHTEILTSGWPFKEQATASDVIPDTTMLGGIAQKEATGELDWRKAHAEVISFYKRQKDLNRLEREYKALLSQVPLDLELYIDLARVYFQEKRFDEMTNILLRSIEIYPTIQAYRTLGDVLLLQKGDPIGSLRYYEKVDGFYQSPTEKLQNGYAISFAYARAGEFQKAKARLQELLKATPDFQPARQLLIEVNKEQEKTSTTK
jgi:tetratricopeptide (TPR) repeat protein